MKNKVAIVTGASSGIGAAVAAALKARGVQVHNFDLSEGVDVRNRKAIRAKVDEIEGIDFLVVNAGIYQARTLDDIDETHVEEIFSTNLKGALWTLQAVLPHMRAKKSGAVVLVGSDQVFVGKPQSPVYGMTKAALAQLTKTVAKENASFGVRCNTVCPAATETPLYWRAVEEYVQKYGKGMTSQAFHQKISEGYPLGRIGQPGDVADAVLYLLSDEARFVTGTELRVDGGFTLK